MIPKFRYISNSKKGINRNINQDKFFVLNYKDFEIYAVFDGVSSFSESYKFIREYLKWIKTNKDRIEVNGENLGEIFFSAHNEVLKLEFDGMSTISVVFINKFVNISKYFNIGDSRIYTFTNQYLEQITLDDSLKYNPFILTKCLGSKDLLKSDFSVKDIVNFNNLLICTDGFYNLMESNLKEYFKAFNYKKIYKIKERLNFLQRRKTLDDSTYILIKNEI